MLYRLLRVLWRDFLVRMLIISVLDYYFVHKVVEVACSISLLILLVSLRLRVALRWIVLGNMLVREQLICFVSIQVARFVNYV